MKGVPKTLPNTLAGWKQLLQAAVTVTHEKAKPFRPEHFSLRSIQTNEAFHPQSKPLPSPPQSPSSSSTTPGSTGGKASSTPNKKPIKESAVLVLLTPMSTTTATTGDCEDLACILTMRAGGLRSHAKQMSFPGGRLDEGESHLDAAIRETWEEVGLTKDQYEIVGPMSRIWSQPSKSWVTPVLAISNDVLFPRINSPDEVESLHYVHLKSLLLESELTHHRMNKCMSSTAPWSVSMPCFFASDEVDQVVTSQPLPPPGAVAPIKEDWALTPTKLEYCKGTMVWGLTAYVLCDMLVRLAYVMNQNVNDPLVFHHSQFVVRDEDEPDDVGSSQQDAKL